MNLPATTTEPEIDRIFGLRRFDEPADAIIYYGNPGIEVNKNGDVVAVYMRSGKTVFPEVRYIIYSSTREVRGRIVRWQANERPVLWRSTLSISSQIFQVLLSVHRPDRSRGDFEPCALHER